MDLEVSEIFSSVTACLEKLKHRFPLCSHPKLLLAVSGGVDSMVLFDVFSSSGLSSEVTISGVLHVDHGIRAESPGDADFVRLCSEARQVPFFTRRLDPPESGIESWGRRKRYEFF